MKKVKSHFLGFIIVLPVFLWATIFSVTLAGAASGAAAGVAMVETGVSLNKPLSMGESVVATVYINIDDPINAIGGFLVFPASALEVKSISDGNSVVNLWIEKPEVVSGGKISFSGITPGGFTSKYGQVFTVTFNVLKDTGVESLYLQDIKAFLNNGSGLEVENIFLGASVNTRDYSESGVFVSGGMREVDNDPPESFAVEATKNSAFFEDQWFLVFATQDKNSGISHYEIKEFRQTIFSFLARYKLVESPYVLSDQKRKSFVYIKAVDNAGNERETILYPLNSLSWYEKIHYQVIIIVLLLASFLLTRKLWKK